MSRKKKNTSENADASHTTRLPRTRKDARERGFRFYDTGEPCKYGHVSHRRTGDGRCMECDRAREKRRRGSPWRWAQLAQNRCKRRAIEIGVECTVTIEDLHDLIMEQELRCPVFGCKLRLKGREGRTSNNSASIDRLDSSLGYVKGNIAVISMRANTIKNSYSSDEILAVGNWLKKQGY